MSLFAELPTLAESMQVPPQVGLRIHPQAVQCAARRATVAAVTLLILLKDRANEPLLADEDRAQYVLDP